MDAIRTRLACQPKLAAQGRRPTVAPSALWWATSACTHERRLVDLTLGRWNRMSAWLKCLDALRRAA